LEMLGNRKHDLDVATTNYEGVQALRFFAAFLVVITHSTLYASERLLSGAGYWPEGATGVNIFFVISGFVMVVSTTGLRGVADGWKQFISRRLIRIVPMYWTATTLKLIALIIIPSTVLHSQFDIIHILFSYFFIPTTNVEGEFKPFLAVGWTLYFEMFFYVLFALALYQRGNLYYFVGAVLAVFAALSTLRTPGLPAATMFFDPVVLQFFFGMLVAATVWTVRGPTSVITRHPILPIALSISGALLLLIPFQVLGLPDAFRTGVPAATIVLGVVWLEPHLKGRLPKTLLLLGDASYVLYLFHPLIAPLVPTVMREIGIHNFTVCVLLSAALAISIGVVIHLFVERPLTQQLRSLARPRRAAQVSI
jgi:exopolysaccharide production protein ExoZ